MPCEGLAQSVLWWMSAIVGSCTALRRSTKAKVSHSTFVLTECLLGSIDLTAFVTAKELNPTLRYTDERNACTEADQYMETGISITLLCCLFRQYVPVHTINKYIEMIIYFADEKRFYDKISTFSEQLDWYSEKTSLFF